MTFKEPQMQTQFNEAPKKLQEIALYFCDLSQQYEIDPEVTRVTDPVAGDSGVHEAKRGIDFRDQHDGANTYTPEQVSFIITSINNMYPRNDGKVVCIHHSFDGMPYHFHLQIPVEWL